MRKHAIILQADLLLLRLRIKLMLKNIVLALVKSKKVQFNIYNPGE